MGYTMTFGSILFMQEAMTRGARIIIQVTKCNNARMRYIKCYTTEIHKIMLASLHY